MVFLLCNQASDAAAAEGVQVEVAWVQCDRAQCRKWHRIPAADLKLLLEGEPW